MAGERRGIGIALIVAANVLAGASYPAQKLALEGLPAASVSALRNVVALVPMAFLIARRRTRIGGWERREWLRLGALGIFAYALPMLFGIVGVELASASNASILILLEPVTIVVLAWFVLRERVRARTAAGVALGLVGALCIVLEGASWSGLGSGKHFAGNVLLALHGCLWGLYTIIAKPLIDRGRDVYVVTAWSVALSLVLLGPAAGLEVSRWGTGAELRAALWWTLALGLTCSFGATVMWVGAIRHLSAGAIAPFVFLQPVSGVLIGVFALGERVSLQGTIGGAVIAAALLLATSSRSGKP